MKNIHLPNVPSFLLDRHKVLVILVFRFHQYVFFIRTCRVLFFRAISMCGLHELCAKRILEQFGFFFVFIEKTWYHIKTILILERCFIWQYCSNILTKLCIYICYLCFSGDIFEIIWCRLGVTYVEPLMLGMG